MDELQDPFSELSGECPSKSWRTAEAVSPDDYVTLSEESSREKMMPEVASDLLAATVTGHAYLLPLFYEIVG